MCLGLYFDDAWTPIGAIVDPVGFVPLLEVRPVRCGIDGDWRDSNEKKTSQHFQDSIQDGPNINNQLRKPNIGNKAE
ncbi:uncharacterized protein LAJ45_07817 [Morchella importuna]|uniref:uncharacterized protein n=1 Tax=Morchella importuna TaxID=1174673 RepID=UPI001E8CCDD6|nr:uncharacterized protein LAJ45_07817 [Morchella importuna]KAH8148053.1 hypothetical protein LAJ45_07817 [Morchella importuna]